LAIRIHEHSPKIQRQRVFCFAKPAIRESMLMARRRENLPQSSTKIFQMTQPASLKYKNLYVLPPTDSKPSEFRGSSLDDLRAVPLAARPEAGHQLDQVQNGQDPDDCKPMNTVGQGVREVRIRDASGASESLTSPSLSTQFMCCTVFRRRRRRPARQIWTLQRSDTVIY
jgi:phage-related protein